MLRSNKENSDIKMYTIFGIGAFQSFVFSWLLLTKKEKKNADKFLAGFFFIAALYLANIFSISFGLWEKHPDIILLITLVKVTYGPLLYFYVLSLIGKTISRKQILSNLIPIIGTYLIILPFIFYGKDDKMQYFTDRFINLPIYISIGTFIEYFLAPCYFIAILILIRRHRQYLIENHSTIDRISLNWMRKLLIGIISIWMLDTINGFAINYTNYPIGFGTTVSFYIKCAFLVFIILIGYHGIKQGNIFSNNYNPVEKNQYEEDIKVLVHHLQKKEFQSTTRILDIAQNLNIPIEVLIASSNVTLKKEEDLLPLKKPKLISDDLAIKYIKSLQSYVEEEKVYLNNELLVQDIAVKLNIPAHHISYAINTKLNQNFYDFINKYRIEESKHRLCSPKYKNLSIIGVAFDCGFNSKATFNRLFKKYTGITPSQYRCTNQ